MAANNFNPQGTDMDAILAALAAVTQQEKERQRQQQVHQNTVVNETPSSNQVYGSRFSYTAPCAEMLIRCSDPQAPKIGSSGLFAGDVQTVRSGSPMIDPAKITEWPMALRCVSKMATQNPNFKIMIRKVRVDWEHIFAEG
jgi:hypothetical protein